MQVARVSLYRDSKLFRALVTRCYYIMLNFSTRPVGDV